MVPRRLRARILTVINCFGVRTGGTVQSVLMVMKIAAIGVLVVCGFRVRAGEQVRRLVRLQGHRALTS